ncbi:ubiquitin-like protein-NEDD8-like protein RUB3 [Bidens hawaiensis]|uniref:ubiquitin-like protein-NEDD8-like protein RUB3 n=1 Tax=Bidens hawaiensis TaxID=980011 RepID=UPI004048F49A
MDLFFDVDKGVSFTVEVGYFDTIQEIKEKVTKYHGIPVQEQTLKFDGKPLPDDLNIHTSNILDGSRLKLITTTTTTNDVQQPPQATTKVKTEETHSPSSSQKMKIIVNPSGVLLEMDMNDSVLKIKEKMNELEGIPLSRIVVYANGNELHDHKSLHECQLVDGSEVDMTLKPPTPPPQAPPLCGLNMKKMKVYVMSKCGEKIGLDVNPSSNVGELRKELEKVRHQGVGFRLPEEGYFFIYKQNVMEEDHSFRWHRVGQGDVVEIFNGCVTGGS